MSGEVETECDIYFLAIGEKVRKEGIGEVLLNF